MLQEDQILQRNQQLIGSEMDDELVMLSMENNEYYGLNSVGKRIWELLETPNSMSFIINTLVNEYEINVEQCKQDTYPFLQQLIAKNILQIQK